MERLHDVDMPQMLAWLDAFVTSVKAMPEVDTVILFGSLAAGTMTAASDIDIAVIIDDASDQRALSQALRAAKMGCFSWPTDLVVLKNSWFEARKSYGGLCLEIHTNGRRLYKRLPERGSA